ncbi:MAG: M14 family metallopeptidase [Planctomycetota bacterium]
MHRGLTLVVTLVVLACSRFGFAQQEEALSPNWNRYHSSAESDALLTAWHREWPGFTKLHLIGKTRLGSPMWVLEITDQASGKAEEKPAYYYDGNIHSSELTSAEVALHFAWSILSQHGKSERIQRLLRRHTLYVRPKFNPDGADVTLHSYHDPRSTPHPYDEDFDGRLDEDPDNDLDGDGAITAMRVENPDGQWIVDPKEPRVMIRRAGWPTLGKAYDVYSEGLDDDGDGKYNEDGVGGIDMNRNFPRNWGQEFEQKGAGPYPLSEPETRCTIEFLNKHRNIGGLFHGHTNGGFLYRLPSTTSWDNFDVADQRLIQHIASFYAKTTGQKVRASFTDPRSHRHGTLISWAYWNYGVVAFVPEFWRGIGDDLNKDGRISSAERFQYNKDKLGGLGFAEWKSFEHPTLGRVEIGGWRRRFTSRNPPTPDRFPGMKDRRLLQDECELYLPWMLWLAETTPRVVVEDVEVLALGTSKTGGLSPLRVSLTVRNAGYFPTNITRRAIQNKTAVPVRAMVSMVDASLLVGEKRVELGHLLGGRDLGRAGRRGSFRRLVFVVQPQTEKAELRLEVASQKGGTMRRVIRLRPAGK